MSRNLLLIVVGTDPNSRSGGIGFALPGYLRALDLGGIEFVTIPTYHPSLPNGKWLLWLRAFPKLLRQIVNSRQKKQRVIIYSHTGSGLSLFREMCVLIFCKLLGAKTVLQLHSFEIDNYIVHPIKRWLFRIAIFPASALAVLTPWWKARLVAYGIQKALFVIHNPLSSDWEKIAKQPRIRKKDKSKSTLLSLARIVPGKGLNLMVEAMPYVEKNIKLVIAGDGCQLPILRERVKTLGLGERVMFTGWVAGDKKQRLMDEADIFCLPSTYDSFGMGFLESMANGLPVIALDWGAIPDVVPDGRCGILIRDCSPVALAETINRLCNDYSLRKSMEAEAKKWVLEKFAACEVSKDILVMMDSVAVGKK